MAYPWDIHRNEVFIGVEAAKDIMRDVAAGRRTLALIGGGTGVGKTYNLRQIARRHLIRHVPEDNPANAESLVSVTWQNRFWPVHALNECDHLLRAERSINVLKLMHETPRKCALYTKEAATNEEHQRSGSRQYRESIPPTIFLLGNLCRHILTTNLNYLDEAVTSHLPKEHWLALLRRGIDPAYIDTSNEMSLFQYVVHLGGDGKMLRAHQHTYDAASRAMAFYIQNATRLPDISAGRLSMIADTIRDGRLDALDRMLGKDAVRDLQLEPATVQVLLWPKRPPKRRPKGKTRRDAPQSPPEPRTTAPDPEPVIGPVPSQEPLTAEWVAREATPHDEIRDILVEPIDPAIAAMSRPVFADGTPDPVEVSPCWRTPDAPDDDPLPPPDPEPETLTMSAAIDLIYRRREVETCESIAAVLQRCALAEWDDDDFSALIEQLQVKADWDHENNGLAQAYHTHETASILFGTRDGVLLYRDHDLCILTWGQVLEIMEPVLAEQAKRRDQDRRNNESHAILRKKLPAQHKLMAMLVLIDHLLALKPKLTAGPEQGIAYIRAMQVDDPQFAGCATFTDYLKKAADLAAGERGEPLCDIKPPPGFSPDPLDVPLRPLTADETKAVQAAYDLPKWKGRITDAHRLRAAFFKACAGKCPQGMWRSPAIWWRGMTGQIPRSMIAKATPMIEQAA